MKLEDVACVIVTRGDVDMAPVLESLPFDEVVVWDNSVREDLKVYGRFAAIEETTKPYIYTQDDDAVCPAADLTTWYSSAAGLAVNVPPGEWPWLAWGALFGRDTPATAFERYLEVYGDDECFYRWPDIIFAHSVEWTSVDLGHDNLPWATAPNRMYLQPDHYDSQHAARRRVQALTDRASVPA